MIEVQLVGYLLLFMATMCWSFVGILVKSASTMLDSGTITFLRFGIGIVFLGIYIWLKDRSFKLRFNMKWIWIGAIGKCCNYFFENIALSIGYSYGNILVSPIQTIFLLLVALFFLKEKISARGWGAALLCIVGIGLISWNGMTVSQFFQGGSWTTLLFTLSALGAAFHVLSQKMLIHEMDAGNMNFSIFLVCSILMALPLPLQLEVTGSFHIWGIFALLLLGLITGLSFYWFSQALKTVSFSVAIIVSNCGVLFTVLWSYLFYRDPITIYIIAGVIVCMAGLLILNLPVRSAIRKADAAKPG
jgi:drug/metabolite transporter (DMT)-like permease